MRDSPPEAARAVRLLAAAALLLVLIVVAASAFIRLAQEELICAGCAAPAPHAGVELAFARSVHRASASLSGVLVLALGALSLARRALRPALGPAAALALVLVATLAALGPLSGGAPGRAVAVSNLLGGLALASVLAWLTGRSKPAQRGSAPRSLALVACCIAAAQCLLGAWAGTGGLPPPTGLLLAHAVLGVLCAVLATALGIWLAGRGERGLGAALVLLAALAPVAGLVSALLGVALAGALGHASAAALLLATLMHADGRLAAAGGFA